MSKFLYPIYKLKTKSYIKWWLYHKKAGGSGILSEILEGFSFNLADTLNRKFKLFEIEGNSVQDGSPSPDNEVPILSSGDNGSINEKIQTRNLLNLTGVSGTNNGISYSVNEKGKLLLNGTCSSDRITIMLPATKINGTYTFSRSITNLSTALKNANGANIFIVNPNIASNTATVNDTIKQLVIYMASGTQFSNKEVELQVELGSTANPFVEHQEQDYSIFVQQPFRSNKDKTKKDKFVIKSDNKKYERHYIARKIFDGTENWYQYGRNIALRNWDNGLTIRHTDQELQGYLCNIATEGRPSETLNNNVFATFNVPGTADWIVFNINITVTEWKAMLAEQYANGNPVYVDYILAEPLDLPCTPEQVEQLENKPSTYKDFTIIQSQDETPAYLKIQYYKEG